MQLLLLFPLKLLSGLLILGAIAYLTVCIFLLLRQNRLIFFPSPTIETTPGDLNLVFEDVWISVETPRRSVPTQSGVFKHQLHSWWIPAKDAEQGVVLYLHGNGYNVGANLAQAFQFHQVNLSVLLIDYRGYGQSMGSFPTEATVYQDARAAWNYLTQERGISSKQIILFGHSLGGAIAIDLALEHPEAAGLIVQSSFTSMRAMVDHIGQFRLFPVDLLLTQQFNSISKVRSLKLPVLYTHGTADTLIPSAMSELLYAATPEPKRLYLIANAEHNNIPEVGGSSYLQELKDFVGLINTFQHRQVLH
ncbi:alpha/beta hydrolase [Kovacikia minuta CCNUW1]|uniref:alpha/beta hydrolase n=1 Tax=Kovacikia minuta TaxID=2931930 RepID=UPI001CCE6C9C|nr:alpha/beta hydrolase [Kovacikia minuta]UBF25650.1 alpha/beta hydrolase [Kovacikia minuta CCNUW1]